MSTAASSHWFIDLLRKLFISFRVRKYKKLLTSMDPKNMPEVVPGVKVGPFGYVVDPNDDKAVDAVIGIRMRELEQERQSNDDQRDHPEKYLEAYVKLGKLQEAQVAAQAKGRLLKRKELKVILKVLVEESDIPGVHEVMKLLGKKRLSFPQYLELLNYPRMWFSFPRAMDAILLLHSGINLTKYRELRLKRRSWREIDLTTELVSKVSASLFLRVINAISFHQVLDRMTDVYRQEFISSISKVMGRELKDGEKELLFSYWLGCWNFDLDAAHQFAFEDLRRQLTIDDIRMGIIQLSVDFDHEVPLLAKKIRQADYLSVQQKHDFLELIKEVKKLGKNRKK